MSVDQTSAERAYARQERVPTTVYDKVDRRWVDSMSATGRRAATSVAAAKLRQWVNRTLEVRPSRGELRAWFTMVLDERRELHNRLEQATRDLQSARETSAVRGQGVAAKLDEVAAWRRRFESVERELDAIQAQRDDALADASELRERVTVLDEDRTRRTKERDRAEQNLLERTAEMSKRYEELRAALEETIAERNELTREAALRDQFLLGPRIGRASCTHTPVGGAE